jgi:hypothetical protein
MASSHTFPSVASRSTLSAAARALAQFVRTVIEGSGKYHPEQHYMRGPGPKWREKHRFDVTTRGT